MRARAAVAALALLAFTAGAAQAPSGAPQDHSAKLRPYAQVVLSRLLRWHDGKREVVVSRGLPGGKPQMLLVPEPGATPRPFIATVGAAAPEGVPLPEGPAVSRDGKRRIEVERQSPTRTRLWLVEGSSRKLLTPEDKADVSWTHPAFAKDGRGIYVLTNRGSDYRRLAYLGIASLGEKVISAQHAWDVDEYAISDDGQRIAFVTNEGGTHVLRFHDTVAGKELPRPPLFSAMITGLQWRPGAREVAFNISSARVAMDVFSYDYEENQLTRWTNGNSRELNASGFPEPRMAKWKAPDGRMVPALVYVPSGIGGKLPVLVEVHADPANPARASFLGPLNYVVINLGIAVIRTNVRGDGERDIAALREWIAGQPEFDGNRVVTMPAGRVLSAASIEQVRRALGD